MFVGGHVATRCRGCLRPPVLLAIQERTMSSPQPDWPYCHECDGSSVGTCSSCGRAFCPQHGGQRLGWRKVPFQRSFVTERSLCNKCTPRGIWLQVIVGTLGVAVVPMGFLLARFLGWLR